MTTHAIVILGPREIRRPRPANAGPVVSTVSNSGGWQKGLSPFVLGPMPLYDGTQARVFENGWQYAKCYARHVGADGKPTADYFTWARGGWDNPRPVRYPMGKGATPAYSWWAGEALGYIDARKHIYFPAYRDLVRGTDAFKRLAEMHAAGPIALFDYDGYDHGALGVDLARVLNEPRRKMGHAFILKAMLLHGSDVRPEDLGGEA